MERSSLIPKSIKTIKYGFRDFYLVSMRFWNSEEIPEGVWAVFIRNSITFLYSIYSLNNEKRPFRISQVSLYVYFIVWMNFMRPIRSPCLPSNIHYLSFVWLLFRMFIRHSGNLGGTELEDSFLGLGKTEQV